MNSHSELIASYLLQLRAHILESFAALFLTSKYEYKFKSVELKAYFEVNFSKQPHNIIYDIKSLFD